MQERNIHTDQVVYMRRPRHRVTEDLVIDTAVPGDVKIEKDKRDKYQELSERERERESVWE